MVIVIVVQLILPPVPALAQHNCLVQEILFSTQLAFVIALLLANLQKLDTQILEFVIVTVTQSVLMVLPLIPPLVSVIVVLTALTDNCVLIAIVLVETV